MTSARSFCATLLLAAAGCSDSVAPPSTFVQFAIDAPLCGSTRITYTFSIDQDSVGTETLVDKGTSHLYPARPGVHVLSVALGTSVFFADTTPALPPDTTFTTIVPVYCS